MPRFNINHNNEWACFSTISDNFVTNFVDKETYEEWRKKEYGMANYSPAEECNMTTLENAIHALRLNRTREDALKCLLWTGLPQKECEELLKDVEIKYFQPKKANDGSYKCPNCGTIVTLGQKVCSTQDCLLKFVW